MFIDAHRHLSYDGTDISSLPLILDEFDISKTVIFGFQSYGKQDQDESVLALAGKYPNRVIPFACNFDFRESSVDYVRSCLSEKGFQGLGEILLGSWTQARYFTGVAFDDDIPVRIFNIAGEYHAPVIFRCDRFRQNEVTSMLRKCRETNFIWSHLGCDLAKKAKTTLVEPEFLRYMLMMFPNLYFDLSVSAKLLSGMVSYKYTEVFLDFPERFLFGTDIIGMYRKSQIELIPPVLDFYSALPDQVRNGFMYQNFMNLLPERK